jgi:hypothetical protein
VPTLPNRRRSGTLAKNNTVNDIIDYLRGDTAQGLLPQLSGEFDVKGEYVICQVKEKAGSYFNNQYKCKVLFAKKPDQRTDSLSFGWDKITYGEDPIVVHHLGTPRKLDDNFDFNNQTDVSTLMPGDIIEARQMVRPYVDEDLGYDTLWVSFTTPRRNFKVRLTGVYPGGGKYRVSIVRPPTADINTDDDLADTDLGENGVDAIGLNVREEGESTHDLSSTGYSPTVFDAELIHINADGTMVLTFDAYQHQNCVTPP